MTEEADPALAMVVEKVAAEAATEPAIAECAAAEPETVPAPEVVAEAVAVMVEEVEPEPVTEPEIAKCSAPEPEIVPTPEVGAEAVAVLVAEAEPEPVTIPELAATEPAITECAVLRPETGPALQA